MTSVVPNARTLTFSFDLNDGFFFIKNKKNTGVKRNNFKRDIFLLSYIYIYIYIYIYYFYLFFSLLFFILFLFFVSLKKLDELSSFF